MGMYHSTYFAYGIHIPTAESAWVEGDRIDVELAKHKDRCPDVGHLAAGDYDHDLLFLVTTSNEIRLGAYGRATEATTAQRANWDHQLANAVQALGYSELPDLPPPGWLCIPDLS
jgi:hypothetical protein